MIFGVIFLQTVAGGGGGVGEGSTLIFSYIRRRGLFFWVQNFEVQFFSGFQKNEHFLGMKILWIFLGDHHKIRLYLGVISMHFWVFFKVNVPNGDIFFFWGGGAIISNIFWGGGVLEIPVFLGGFFFLFFFLGGGCTVDAGPEPTYEEKMRAPPTPTPWDCRMTTTKSCRFVGGRDATEALPA